MDADNRTHIVPCEEDHSYEVTSVVDLQNVFPQGTPSTEDQDQHLKTVCTNAALEYIGGDDALYNSTLSPFWTTVTTLGSVEPTRSTAPCSRPTAMASSPP